MCFHRVVLEVPVVKGLASKRKRRSNGDLECDANRCTPERSAALFFDLQVAAVLVGVCDCSENFGAVVRHNLKAVGHEENRLKSDAKTCGRPQPFWHTLNLLFQFVGARRAGTDIAHTLEGIKGDASTPVFDFDLCHLILVGAQMNLDGVAMINLCLQAVRLQGLQLLAVLFTDPRLIGAGTKIPPELNFGSIHGVLQQFTDEHQLVFVNVGAFNDLKCLFL